MWNHEMMRWGTENIDLKHVWYELVEVVAAIPDTEAMKEEMRDVVLSFLLYAAQRKVYLSFPARWTSIDKLRDRVIQAKEILVSAQLYDPDRHLRDPYYWRRYMIHGSNLEKPVKRELFLLLAARDSYIKTTRVRTL